MVQSMHIHDLVCSLLLQYHIPKYPKNPWCSKDCSQSPTSIILTMEMDSQESQIDTYKIKHIHTLHWRSTMWWCKFTAFLFTEKANKLCSFYLLLQILRLPADTDLYVFYGKWQKKRRNASVSYKFWSFLDFQLLSFGRFSNIFLDIHYQTLTYVQRDGRTNGERVRKQHSCLCDEHFPQNN